MIQLKNKSELESDAKSLPDLRTGTCGGRRTYPGGDDHAGAGSDSPSILSSVRGLSPSFLGYGGFPGTACISVNDEVIHGIPSSERVLREGDIVSVDVGACIGGFHGDNAFTFPVGQIGEKAKKLLDVTQKSLYLGIEAAQAGHRVGDIGAAVQALVEQNGFAVVRQYVGHGVGHNLHEDPEIPNFGRAGHGVRLVPGMTIAIEPMVNQAGEGVRVLDNDWTVVTRSGSLSAHFEHTIAITEQGPVILTTP